MILSNLWMTLQKIEAAGHGDYIVNFAASMRQLKKLSKSMFNNHKKNISLRCSFFCTILSKLHIYCVIQKY